MLNFFARMTRNVLSLVGAAITTASAVLIVTLFLVESVGHGGGPYTGILAFLVLPGLFVLGLVLIPVGLWIEGRRRKKSGRADDGRLPVFDFNAPTIRRGFLIFVALTMVNAVILAVATYKGVEVMDSTPFCGAACHTVMHPEFTAYQRSPHARVTCVSCHIGPGADWFVKSKLSGSWQLVSVTFDLFPRPIPTPVHNLRPARETCEQCHWPEKFVGDRLRVLTHYADDEENSESKTVLLMRIGGVEGRESQGIHWHVDPNVQIRYRSDEVREKIYEVELRAADGQVYRFTRPGETVPPEAAQEWRTMDCIDCHNRPSHTYRLPEREVDTAIESGRIDASLPYIHREALAALKQGYPSHDEARAAIGKQITEFYAREYPSVAAEKRELIDNAVRELGVIYTSNVFPSMEIEWGTYPNHIGHEQTPGCYRCHDDELQTEKGKTIPQDCDLCHSLLAMDEKDPAVLKDLRP